MKSVVRIYLGFCVLTIGLLIGAAAAAMLGEQAVGFPMFVSFLICSAMLFIGRRVLERKLHRG